MRRGARGGGGVGVARGERRGRGGCGEGREAGEGWVW